MKNVKRLSNLVDSKETRRSLLFTGKSWRETERYGRYAARSTTVPRRCDNRKEVQCFFERPLRRRLVSLGKVSLDPSRRTRLAY